MIAFVDFIRKRKNSLFADEETSFPTLLVAELQRLPERSTEQVERKVARVLEAISRLKPGYKA